MIAVLAIGGCAPDPAPEDSIASATATESPIDTPASSGSDTPEESPTTALPESSAPSSISEESPDEDQEAALKDAVSAYTDAYFAADYETAVEDMWSERCLSDNSARNQALGEISAQKVNYPEGTERPQAENITIDRFDGDLAVVTYDYRSSTDEGTVSSQPWVLEDGEWKFDGC
ncbi:hypothetical protein ACFQ8E_09310 [Isoptericola sp. NPDC056573]|uniref:hypothetical protein n=1 Tax=Isoptericola sp. NPDC056573 TaxID=3345868 RepID=UPI003678148A